MIHTMITEYRHTKQITRLMAGSSQLLAILMSKLRSSLGAAWEQPRSSLEYAYSMLMTTFLRPFSSKRAEFERRLAANEITARPSRDYGSSLTRLRIVMSLLLMLIVGSSSVWGQTPYSGVYYIANDNTSNGHPGKVYSSASDTEKYYLVPAADPQQTSAIDAYYSPNHNETQGDPTKPFLATALTNKDLNSIWIVKECDESGYYFIIHALTGKYVIYEVPLPNDPNSKANADETKNGKRKTMHLQTIDNGDYNPSTNDNFKFVITTSGTGYNICPKRRSGWFWNPAGQNNDVYYGQSSGENLNLYRNGLVGVYNNTGTNSIWHFEDASSATTLTPVISDVEAETNTFTITSPAAAFSTIRYTTDGSTTPDASTGTSATSGSPITITGNWSVQAVGVFESFVTPVAGPKALEPASCAKPVITYDKTSNTVAITSEPEDANIYYTLDGETPTSSSTPYGGPFGVTDHQTVKAIAIKTGFLDSEITSVQLVLNPTITLAQTEYTYNGSAIEPTVSSVKDGGTPIDIGEYTVDYMNNTNAGTATVNIVDNPGGAYLVSGSTTFTINPAEVTLTANSGTETYDGTEKTVSGFTSSVGELIFAGVSASGSGTNVGTYDVTFTGVNIGTTMDTSGNCVVTNIVNGTLTISQKSIGDGEVAADDITISFVDNTSDEVEVEHGERPLTSDDYTVSVVDDGRGYQVATVTGIGNYTGSAKISRIKFSFFNSGSDDENVKNVATIAASMDIVTPDNMVAYIVTGLNVTKHEVKLTSIEYVPKDVPVLLLTDSPVEAYTATPKAVTTPADVSRNILMILPPGKKVEASQVYMFHQGQFFLTTTGTLTKYKFCLENPYYELVSPVIPNPSNAPLRFVIEGLTGIHEIQTAGIEGTSEDIWFSVDGLRLTGKPTRKGLYIKNGNKIVVK